MCNAASRPPLRSRVHTDVIRLRNSFPSISSTIASRPRLRPCPPQVLTDYPSLLDFWPGLAHAEHLPLPDSAAAQPGRRRLRLVGAHCTSYVCLFGECAVDLLEKDGGAWGAREIQFRVAPQESKQSVIRGARPRPPLAPRPRFTPTRFTRCGLLGTVCRVWVWISLWVIRWGGGSLERRVTTSSVPDAIRGLRPLREKPYNPTPLQALPPARRAAQSPPLRGRGLRRRDGRISATQSVAYRVLRFPA